MSNLTPMMAQYKRIKENYADCILMFRLGDFYEMFFEDAVEAAKILQITLTARNKAGENQTPMCGIPYHAVDQYLWKLTKVGKKVAICDQVTAPNGKGIVEREVIRVVTPGTTFDENLLDQKTNNYVVAVVESDGHFGLAFADVTTGEFKVTELMNLKELKTEMARLQPAECIANEELIGKKFFEGMESALFPYFYNQNPEESLKKYFEIKSLDIFGLEGKNPAILAAGMLFEYLKETQKTDLKHVQKIAFYHLSEFMPMDESCVRNLELLFTSREGKKFGSLIWVLDNTVTAMGGRLLRNWLLHPLLSRGRIEERLEQVENFVKNSSLLRAIRENLEKIYDMERLLSRLSLGTGNARDLLAMKESLKVVPTIKKLIKNENLFELNGIVELIERAIVDEAPISLRDGGMIRSGFNQELDELRSISTEGKTFIKNLQEREIGRTGISSMKVKFNKVFGYYIEVSKANLAAVPADYIRKQTLVNAERFITPELKEYEEKVLSAEDKIKELEYELFYKVRMELLKEIIKVQNTARELAKLDVLSTFAFNAEQNNYVKPKILEDGGLEIVNGRHPVIEKISPTADFVPNDLRMNDENNFMLITGPNMGGKSTYLRQVALIALMAQIGSYVPAEKVTLPIVDRIFTRVGAADNLVKGNSTFMVEMQEVAFILNNASEKSLIILDEVGRGTSTYDGVSIAWAMTEFLHDTVRAKTLFATHYHELVELAEKLPRSANYSVAVRENEREGVVFLYKIVEGGVDKSYGIEVAKLAGLPVEIVGRARGVLEELESKHIGKARVNPDQMVIFDGQKRQARGLLTELKNLELNKMTPLEAMQKLNEFSDRSDNLLK